MQITGKFNVMQNFPQDVNWILFDSTGPLWEIKNMRLTKLLFVKTFTRPGFLGPKFYTKRVHWNNDKFATNSLIAEKCKNYTQIYTVIVKVYTVILLSSHTL